MKKLITLLFLTATLFTNAQIIKLHSNDYQFEKNEKINELDQLEKRVNAINAFQKEITENNKSAKLDDKTVENISDKEKSELDKEKGNKDKQILKLKKEVTKIEEQNKKDKVEESKPQFFDGGYLNFLDNGSMVASIELLKLTIGNPGGWNLPVYVFTGATRETGDDSVTSSKSLINDLLNPKGGIANVSTQIKGSLGTQTKFFILKPFLHAGVKYTNGTNSTGENSKFYNVYSNIGLWYQTRAWADEDKDNLGYFWISVAAKGNIMSQSNMDKFFIGNDDNKLISLSFDTGIEISKVINLNFGIEKIINNKSVTGINEPIFKIALDLTSNN